MISPPSAYAAAVGQRNAALRRVLAGVSATDALEPWSDQVVSLGARLVDARRHVLSLLAPAFAERAAELGLEDASIGYDAEPPTRQALDGLKSAHPELAPGGGPAREGAPTPAAPKQGA